MSQKSKDVTTWSDEELDEEAARLAAERTRVRLAQNEINAEIEIRATLTKLSGAAREALVLRLNGGVALFGETAGNVEETK